MSELKTVTKEECVEVLEKDLHSKIFKIVKCEEKSMHEEVLGLMGGHYKLEITVEVEDNVITKNYFVKRMQSNLEIQNEMIKIQGAYEKEKFVYEYLDKLQVLEPNFKPDFLPKCFLMKQDKKFIFEDLNAIGYLVNASGTFKLNMEELKLATEALAKFHASSVIYENRKSLEIGAKYKLSDEYSQYLQEHLYRNDKNYFGNKIYKQSLKAVVALIDKCDFTPKEKEEIKSKVKQIEEKIPEYVKESKKFHNVLTHSDLWCNNLLFKYDENIPINCKIIDYQTIKYTVPAYDFLHLTHILMANHFTKEDKKEIQEYYYNYLQRYLEEFDIDINNYFTYEEFVEGIKYLTPFIIIHTAMAVTIYVMMQNGSTENDPDIFYDKLYKNRTDYCIKTYDTDKLFREFVNYCLYDLKQL